MYGCKYIYIYIYIHIYRIWKLGTSKFDKHSTISTTSLQVDVFGTCIWEWQQVRSPKSNILAPENRPKLRQKGRRIVFQPSIFRGKLAVSLREVKLISIEKDM